MRQALTTITQPTRGQGFYDLTAEVSGWASAQGIERGLLTIFCRHTSASLTIQENADPSVRADLKHFLEAVAPEDESYEHADEGPDDMPAHIRTMITHTSLALPLEERRLVLGTWQAIYLLEHRRSPHRRAVVLHLIGE